MNRLRELTIEVQKAVGAKADGIWGPETAGKVLDKLGVAGGGGDVTVPPHVPEISILPDSIDERSRLNINTLQKWLRPLAAHFLEECLAAGIPAKITSGWRTDAEQERLYAQGRSVPGKIVTHARAGYSNHNFGIAFDITLFDESGKPIWESPLYTSAGEIGKKLGLTWGGDWNRPDEPHFELRPEWAKNLREDEMLAALRARRARGESYV